MNNRVRVGDVIYDDNKKVVALFTHGAWYEKRSKGKGLELNPLDAGKAAECDRMPDALTLTMSAGEMDIIETAECIMHGLPRESSMAKNVIVDTVRRGVVDGLSKFGPFDPDKETRDLDAKILKCLRNVMVYSCMKLLIMRNDPRSGLIKSVFIDCARAWLRMR